MFDWLWAIQRKNNTDYGVALRIPQSSVERIKIIVAQSSHQDLVSLVKEAFLVVETVYKQSEYGREVHCRVEKGKIVMYINDDGGDGSEEPEPIPVPDNTNVFQLFSRKAA